jgi:hypothetical protein
MNRQSATLQRILTDMAYNREEFKNKVEEKVGGALLEHYKAALASLNKQTKWVQHWQGEANRLLESELVVVLLHSIKGFKDRKKAAREVLEHLQSIDDQYRRAAEHTVKRDYQLTKLRASITADITAQFYESVQDVLETNL